MMWLDECSCFIDEDTGTEKLSTCAKVRASLALVRAGRGSAPAQLRQPGATRGLHRIRGPPGAWGGHGWSHLLLFSILGSSFASVSGFTDTTQR